MSQMLMVLGTGKKTNEWILEKAGVDSSCSQAKKPVIAQRLATVWTRN